MPGQQIAQANPPPDPSQLPDDILKYGAHLDTKDYLSHDELKKIDLFTRSANYIAAAMIFLNDNVLLEKKITHDMIKPRLLGHWGTCPGLVLVYAHLNRIIKKTGLDALYVVGPGHGAPAVLSCLWLEDSMSTFMPEYTRDYEGLKKLISRFSVPGGFPSHINAETPGAIHEGGELGYALSVSFGAVMDNPDLIVACVVGDGEAETGPTATAWHANKYIDPAESGAVLPILHVNGFKISERTIFGVMDNKEIIALYTGYGYHVRVVEDIDDIHNDLAASLEWAVSEIRKIQKAARSGSPIVKPRWPMLVLRTPKGWTGPKTLHGEFIEGSFRSHQVPLPLAKTDPEELALLQKWLETYNPKELFTKEGLPIDAILDIIPPDGKKLGLRDEAYKTYQPLHTPDWRKFTCNAGEEESCMKAIGRFLKDVVEENPKTFRIFSPDELVSNKLDAVLDATSRNFQWDVASRAKGGRVVEILSEHTCQGMLQGYTLTGRTGLFPSYEAFLGIVHTMMVQYSKFAKMASETTWRQPCGSLNYLETSTWTRQEHNGFSHQNPSFIGAVLNLKAQFARASVWKFASVDDGVNPDVVLVGIGVEMTFEVIAAAALLRKLLPALRVRVVNVTDLMILSAFGQHPHALTREAFETLFTTDRRVHFNYHGYPIELRGLLGGRQNTDRITIEGYSEEGTTTSPFDMMLCNHTSRYDVAIAAIRGGSHFNERVAVDAHGMISYIKHMGQKERDYIYKHGKDHDDIFSIPKFD
ncbi:hypothetical protein H0H87_003698 [Tephrocybe sp. NHM501043]|nr:hypothetical protein H0H87_003698 [Tephrocybe sp. NHM501043]